MLGFSTEKDGTTKNMQQKIEINFMLNLYKK
jgi:hypothetical protein